MNDAVSRQWDDALTAAMLTAIDPVGLGGIRVRAGAGPVRDAWAAHLRAVLPQAACIRRMPAGIADGPLLGGLDLSATLQAGRPIVARGLLADSDGGVVVLAMAERLPAATAARLAAVMDAGEVRAVRDGISLTHQARFGLVALDEGTDDDEAPPAALLDRLAFDIDLSGVPYRSAMAESCDVTAARAMLTQIVFDDALIETLAVTAQALGVASMRALMMSVRAAVASAALAGRDHVLEADVVLAGRLVLGPRATRLPSPEQSAQPEPPPETTESEAQDEDRPDPGEMPETVLAAITASLPEGLLARLRAESTGRSAARNAGRVGETRRGKTRGRPAGVMRGAPRDGQRLNVIETLRAAAPWQRLRRAPGSERIAVLPEDFRVNRTRVKIGSTTIFVVDASGSQALNRLAEAKGAAERLLADCYVRRDHVAVLGFRGRAAELLLPPTRSLVRAKRSLAGMAGGGGTPLAAGIDAAAELADSVRRRGQTPTIVFLTDGQGNVARDGTGGRARAEADATAAARRLRALGLATLLVDTSPRARPAARALADTMHASYLALPYSDPSLISRAVQAARP
jgi:magnesium chelatase subunit D